MGKNKNGKQKARLEEVPELEEGEEYYDYSAEEDEDGYGLADMLGGEDNWAAGATAGQYDPWGGSKPQAASSSQWGATIPTPAQLAAQHAQLAAQHAAASGTKGGKKGNANNNNQKGDKKGGGKPAAAGAQAWQTWGMDTRPPAAADAWGNSAGGWDSGGGWAPDASDWGASTDDKRWETTQQSKHAQQGHWTGWGEEAKRLPKVTSVPQGSVGIRNDLTAQQHSEILQALLNHPNQGHDVRSAYEQQKGGKHGGQQRDQKGGGQPKGGGQWDQHKGGGQWDQPKGGGQWDQPKGGGQWDQPKGGGQWDQPKGGGQWDQPKGGGQWDQQMGGGQWDQQKGGEQQKGGKKQQKKENKQKNKKNQQQQGQQKQRQTDPWATGGWDDGGGWGMPEEDEYDEHGEDRRVHFTPITSNLWGGSQHDSTYNMPSKTLAHAYKGTTTSLFTGVPRNKVSESANIQFIDSKGAALMPVHQALFGKTRMAKDRIHWMFSPNKDQRVFDLLFWIEQMAYHLGAYGLHRFLQSRERGALFANADYLPPNGPNEPAFDWLSFDQLQATRDRVLQESVAFYDPGVTTIVFVFLPSKSGNSVAMWRRRITVSHDTRASRLNEIHLAMMGLRREKEYVVHVDEIPGAKVPDGKKAAAALADAKKSSSHKYDYSRTYYPYETGHVQKPKTRKWWHIF